MFSSKSNKVIEHDDSLQPPDSAQTLKTSEPLKSKAARLMNPVRLAGSVPKKYRGYIREKAIDRARTRIIVAGNDPKRMSQEDLEIVVKEEEDKIKGSIREKGLMAVLALLGLNLFV